MEKVKKEMLVVTLLSTAIYFISEYLADISVSISTTSLSKTIETKPETTHRG